MNSTPRVCVVGAGPSGLVATKTLAGAGLDVDCLELSSRVGGTWVLGNPNGRAAAYHSLETNTMRAMSRLSDYEMPESWPDFPSHAQVAQWWESYVEHFGFRGRIQFETEVLVARPLSPSGWVVELRDASGVREERYDALLACSGAYWQPRVPEISGAFDGTCFHARAYRDPQEPVALSGKRVVVVGIGNTGCELACEIAGAGARSVLLSARSGTWILPKRKPNGRPAAESAPMMHPCDPVPTALRILPAPWRDKLFERFGARLFHRMFGEHMARLQAQGLPAPPPNPLDKRPTVCDPLLGALEGGTVAMRPPIERFEGSDVVFADGRRDPADVVLFATGYRLAYPYLPDDLIDPRADDVDLFWGTMHPARPDLFVVGVGRPTGAFWPMAEVQSQLAAALLSGRYRLPGTRPLRARTRPIFGRGFNPALYGLAVREEIRRGERRARRHA